MREIKFRAWDRNRKAMLPVQSMYYTDGPKLVCIIAAHRGKTQTVGHEVDVMQFTGLKDKNGKEIYVGDVLQDDRKDKYQVFFTGGGFVVNMFKDEFKDTYTGVQPLADQQTSDFFEHSCEVIGNIYENPELMK